MNPRHPFISARADARCEYCRAPEGLFNFPFEVEHIVPNSRDGQDEDSNLALACRSCNSKKAAFVSGYDPEGGTPTRLFNPRLDTWDEHFHANLETGEIVGRTAIGRTTINRLTINGPVQVTARRQWIRLGLFP